MQNYYNPYLSQNIYQNQPQPNQSSQTQIQNNGFLPVPDEAFARNYPVAYGNSVMFKDENAPYIYTKTMGFSQMDVPKFEKYRLVKEEPSERPNLPQNGLEDIKAIISSIDKINEQIEALWSEIDKLKNAKSKNLGRNKRDKDGDDEHDEQSE
jgi:hypothetical protein